LHTQRVNAGSIAGCLQ